MRRSRRWWIAGPLSLTPVTVWRLAAATQTTVRVSPVVQYAGRPFLLQPTLLFTSSEYAFLDTLKLDFIAVGLCYSLVHTCHKNLLSINRSVCLHRTELCCSMRCKLRTVECTWFNLVSKNSRLCWECYVMFIVIILRCCFHAFNYCFMAT